jgi:hypothetical protein
VARSPVCHAAPDDLIQRLLAQYDGYTKDHQAIRAATFLAALPVCTRFPHPEKELLERYGISAEPHSLLESVDEFVGDHICASAAKAAIKDHLDKHRLSQELFGTEGWAAWREVDGAAFCDLGRSFFTQLNELCFAEVLGHTSDDVARFAREASFITRSFSVRWFKACATDQVPKVGSIKWYLGHCLGKLDLELSRELSDWVEPTGNPWKRRKRAPEPELSLAHD